MSSSPPPLPPLPKSASNDNYNAYAATYTNTYSNHVTPMYSGTRSPSSSGAAHYTPAGAPPSAGTPVSAANVAVGATTSTQSYSPGAPANTSAAAFSTSSRPGSNPAAPQPSGLYVPLPSEVTQKRKHVIESIDDETLLGIFESSDRMESIVESQQERAKNNIGLAREVIDKCNGISQLRQHAQKCLDQSKGLENVWHDVESQMYRTLQPWSGPAIQNRLSSAVDEAEHASEALSSTFLDSTDPDISEFIRAYRKERQLYHLRRERLERWHEERVKI